MIATLRTVWPPREETGTMTNRTEYNGHLTPMKVSMTDLHQGAWWTGLRIDVPGPGPGQEFLVTLVDMEGVISSLRIMTGEWQPFQWALPAHVAQQRQMMLHIAPTLPSPIPFLQIKLSFEELPPLSPQTALHFLCDNYTVAFSLVPRDVVDYVVIPTMKRLYEE
jgi:hypothetical protein